MSILIKGMEMPENCGECRFAGVCGVHKYEEWPDIESIILNDVIGVGGTRDEDCPLVEVPPHGRLIDADTLTTTFCEWGTRLERQRKLVITICETKQAIVDIIEDAPTIIEAEE